MKTVIIVIVLLLLCGSNLFGQDSLGVRFVGGYFDYWTSCFTAKVMDDRIYVATRGSGLQVLALDTLEDSPIIGLNEQVHPSKVAVTEEYIYIIDLLGRFVILTRTDNPEIIGEYETQFTLGNDLVITDGHAYVAFQRDENHQIFNNILILDVSDPERPDSVAIYATPGAAFGLAMMDEFLIIADGSEDLIIVDISDPDDITEVASLELPGIAFDVSVDGNTVVVAAYREGIRIIDISNIEEPLEVGFFRDEEYDRMGRAPEKVLLNGEIVYATSDYFIESIDISDPENPNLIWRMRHFSDYRIPDPVIQGDLLMHTVDYYGNKGVYIYDKWTGREIWNFLRIGSATKILVDEENRAFLIEGEEFATDFRDNEIYPEVKILDISNANHPEVMGSFDIVSQGYMDIVSEENLVFIAAAGPGYILNIEIPNRVQIVGSIWGESVSINWEERVLFVGTSSGESILFVYDLSDLEDPVEITEWDPDLQGFYCMEVIGDFLYSANGNGWSIVNVSDLENPEVIRQFNDFSVWDLCVSGQFLYIAAHVDDQVESGIWIFDISEPDDPQEVIFFELDRGDYERIDVEGDFAVLTGKDALTVIDISDGEQPEVVGLYSMPWMRFYDVALKDQSALVAGGSHLYVFDLSAAMGFPFSPEWQDVPDNIIATETDTVQFTITAIDMNGDSLTIEMDQNNLPEAASFSDNGDGSGSFSWITGYDDAGGYLVGFTVSDGELTAEAVVDIEIQNLNRSPIVAINIPDLSFDEDTGVHIVALLDTVFADLDGDGLWYSLSDVPDSLNMIVNRTNVLLFEPLPDYNLENGTDVVVTAHDPDDATASDTFSVVIVPVVESVPVKVDLPTEFALGPIFPNPFNSSTGIHFDVPVKSPVSIAIFDLTGRRISTLANGVREAGSYTVIWDGKDYPAGVYFVTFTSNEFSKISKVVCIR